MVDFPVPLAPTTMLRLRFASERHISVLLLLYVPCSRMDLYIAVRQEVLELDPFDGSGLVVANNVDGVLLHPYNAFRVVEQNCAARAKMAPV